MSPSLTITGNASGFSPNRSVPTVSVEPSVPPTVVVTNGRSGNPAVSTAW